MTLPARMSHFVCHTFPFSNVILCGSGKGSVLRHARGTSAKRRPVWRRHRRPSTRGGAKAGAVCARQQAKSGRSPSRPVHGGGLGAYRPRFLFCTAFRHRRSQNHTFCKQPATMATGDRAGSTAYTRNVRNPCTASRRKTGVIQRRDETRQTCGRARVGSVRPNASASHGRCTETQGPRTGKRLGPVRPNASASCNPPHGNARPAHGRAAIKRANTRRAYNACKKATAQHGLPDAGMQSFFHAVCLFSAILSNGKASMAASRAVMRAF